MQVVMKNTTRLCSEKPIVTVNGRFPGPTLVAREDDTVLVKVVNHVKYNVSIHWWVCCWLQTLVPFMPLSIFWLDEYCCLHHCDQAWNQTAADRLGRWPSIHNAVSSSARTELRVQFHHYWSKGHPTLACTYPLAQGHCPWWYCHLAQARCSLPISYTTQGRSHCIRWA